MRATRGKTVPASLLRWTFGPVIPVVVALLSSAASSAADVDTGKIELWCEGQAQLYDQELGSDQTVRNVPEEGAAVIDFDEGTIDLMGYRLKVPLASVSEVEIVARRPLDRSRDSTGASIKIDRLTGEANFAYEIYDAKRDATWNPYIFAGRCEKGPRKY